MQTEPRSNKSDWMHDRSALMQEKNQTKEMGGIPMGVTLFLTCKWRENTRKPLNQRPSWEIVRLNLPFADTQTKAQVGTITTACSYHVFFLWRSRAATQLPPPLAPHPTPRLHFQLKALKSTPRTSRMTGKAHF